jgi:hypothetical protein
MMLILTAEVTNYNNEYYAQSTCVHATKFVATVAWVCLSGVIVVIHVS